jgi:probable rRNA maturation factor
LTRARPRSRKKKVQVEIIVGSARWRRRPKAKTIVKKAISAAAIAASTPGSELAIVLVDDSAIRAFNRQWRGKNVATNVLSFPAAAGSRWTASPYIGDIVIAYETTAREAAAEDKPFNHHLAHLAVHGFLHLIGYDHDKDTAAEEMEQLERRILARIDVPDPYASRDAKA